MGPLCLTRCPLVKIVFFYLFSLLSLDSLVIPQDNVCHETVGVSFFSRICFVLRFLVWFFGLLVELFLFGAGFGVGFFF